LNSRIKAEPGKPARLYVGDFDNNGQVECVPAYFKTDGKAYPYFMKGELQAQIPALKKEFLYFSDYAGKTMEEVFTREQLKNVSVLQAEQSQSCLFRNDGTGTFEVQPLPLQAQLSYVFSIITGDLNGDRKQDIFLAGNFHGVKPQMGRFDASYGTTLVSDARGGFRCIPPGESGLFVRGEVRDVQRIKSSTGTYLLIARNNDSLKIFDRSQKFY
jgi:hypothetical protein